MRTVRLLERNAAKFKRELEQEDKARKKAAITAAKVEAFRLRKELKDEIRKGAPGGKKFAPLREIRKAARRPSDQTPLRRLAMGVQYLAWPSGNQVSIGYFGMGRSRVRQKGTWWKQTWPRLAYMHQEGFVVDPGELNMDRTIDTMNVRSRLRKRGFTLSKSRSPRLSAAARFHFLKKTTTMLRVPARPIIEPFWDAHKHETSRNIEKNFNRKMQGERI